ncbi:MAG TPA: hypothetical protein DEB36_07975 [Porphyromonadaceae bacterium]|jgi:hypothetical protein|nr:Hypothetical protein PEIBARAKI_5495 [Petrimonas sp. IBARAKI]HBU45687.1 hypothetical protein [Porphyromonadaceae bacterium]
MTQIPQKNIRHIASLFKNTVLGDLVYSAALFGLFEMSLSWFPGLRTPHEAYTEAKKIVSKSK